MSLLIDDGPDFKQYLETQLDRLSLASPKDHQHDCPHCRRPVRYPLIARRKDIEDFRQIMESLSNVLDEAGITAKVLALLHAKIGTAVAIRKALAEHER